MKTKLLFLLVLILGCVTVYNPATKRKEVYFINDRTEVAMGEKIAYNIIRENKIIKEKAKLSYLENIGKRLVEVSDRSYLDYNFYILDEEGINAFALPGGYIFVNKQLLSDASEDEIAFVLAHELGHVAARHSVKRLQVSLGMNLILNIALKEVGSNAMNQAVDIVYNVVALGYSRGDELLADSLAVKYAHKAGYNPQAGISLMNKLKQEKKDDYTLIFLRSHPPVSERIKNIRARIKELKLVPPVANGKWNPRACAGYLYRPPFVPLKEEIHRRMASSYAKESTFAKASVDHPKF